MTLIEVKNVVEAIASIIGGASVIATVLAPFTKRIIGWWKHLRPLLVLLDIISLNFSGRKGLWKCQINKEME